MYLYVYLCVYLYVYIDICLCLRTENRSRKTHVFEYRDCGVGWGGNVNVPCTSCMKYCHAAEIPGIVYYVTCCYAADGVGWGGLRWGGVGWGGMLTFLVLRTWNISTLLRSLGSFTTLHVCTLLRSLGSFTTLNVATWSFTLGSFTAMTLKSQKTRPKFFQDFQSSNQHGTVVKSPFKKKKNVRFMGKVSGPAGCLYIYICVCVYFYLFMCIHICIYVYI